MTTIGNAPSTAVVAPVLSGRITNPAACPGQHQEGPHHPPRAPALRGPLGTTNMRAVPAVGSDRPESGPR